MKKSDTQMIKGLAICILLFHHLFYSTQPGLGIMIGDKYLANIVAEYLKVCVALFLVHMTEKWCACSAPSVYL